MKRTKTETLQPSGCCREDTIQITTQNHEEAYFAPSDRFENYLENYYIAIPPIHLLLFLLPIFFRTHNNRCSGLPAVHIS